MQVIKHVRTKKKKKAVPTRPLFQKRNAGANPPVMTQEKTTSHMLF